jgi:hypothetical protein
VHLLEAAQLLVEVHDLLQAARVLYVLI